jgi:hypothetical protein
MNDPYRFENLTPDQLEAARQEMLLMKSPTGEPMNPNWIDRVLSGPDAAASFNKRPPEVREAFFVKIGATPDLGDIIRQRLQAAPEEKPSDLRDIIQERIQSIGQAEKQAVAKEQQTLAAAVPQVDASGRVMGTASQQPVKPKARSFQDYLTTFKQAISPDIIPAGETVAALGSQAVVSPVAAVEQLVKKGVQPGSQDVFAQRMKESTYEPRTAEAQGALQEIGKAFEASKLPPVATGALPTMLPRTAPVKPGEKPRLTYQEFQAQQKIIKGQDPVGLPGLVSVGAAGRKDPVAVQAAIDALPLELRAEAMKTPIKDVNLNALESHVQASTLPEPLRLTKGQATGDLVALSNELNRRAELPNIAQRLGEQNKALVNNLSLIREKAAPDVFGTKQSDFGQQVIDGYMAIDKARTDNISKLYGELEQAAGGNFPIDAQKFVQSADQQLKKKLKSEFLPPEIDRQLQSYRDGARMDFEQFEALRTNLATEIRKAESAKDGNKSFALGVVRDSLENLPLAGEAAKLKPLADAARKAAKERFDALKKDPAYSAAVDGKVAPENFVETFVIGKGKGTEANVRQMMAALGKGTPEQQAIAAGLMEIISRKAIDGQGNFSQAAYNKILRDLDPKLMDVFDPDSVKYLKNLGEVSRKVMAQPKGGFANNSNTLVGALAEKAGKGAEQVLNIAIPGASLGTMAAQARQRKKAQKFERETLEPLAGMRQERTLSEILKGQ